MAAKAESCLVNTTNEVLYIDQPAAGDWVLLKVIPIIIHHQDHTMATYAILDDGSGRTILLTPAARKIGLQGTPEALPLRTI